MKHSIQQLNLNLTGIKVCNLTQMINFTNLRNPKSVKGLFMTHLQNLYFTLCICDAKNNIVSPKCLDAKIEIQINLLYGNKSPVGILRALNVEQVNLHLINI